MRPKKLKPEIVPSDDSALLAELRGLIESAQVRVAQSVNRELVLLYWDLGQRIRVQVLGEERAEYGERIVATVSRQLASKFGSGFSHCAPRLGRSNWNCYKSARPTSTSPSTSSST